MPTVRYTADGGAYRVGGHTFEPGDEADVDPELAAHLADVESFDVLEAPSEGDADENSDGGDEQQDEEAEADSGGLDVDAFLDRTPVGDVADDILDGEADDHLDELAEAADRVTVHDAIGERRAELEG